MIIPENTNEVKLNELRKKLFSELGNETSKDIFFNLIQEIINIRVRKNEKCKVLFFNCLQSLPCKFTKSFKKESTHPIAPRSFHFRHLKNIRKKTNN